MRKQFEKAGVEVHYSFNGVKVHSKLALVRRIENEKPKYYAYLSTGNFHEDTSKIYTDLGIFTSKTLLIDELIQEITIEYNMTTIVITHDMNSVMGIGEKIFFLHKGIKKWEGNKKEILNSDDVELNNLVYASTFLKELKKQGRI